MNPYRHNYDLRAVRLLAGRILVSMYLLGAPWAVSVSNAQSFVWDFENGNKHGFTFFSLNPATPAPANPNIAGDESVTGVGGPNGLPAAGIAWTIGSSDQYNGQLPAVPEGCHDDGTGVTRKDGLVIPAGALLYSNCNDPFGVAEGGGDELLGPFDFTNARGQKSYLSTYDLNQWGDVVHLAENDQVARSPDVVLPTNAVLLAWVRGGGAMAPVPAGDIDYETGSSGIAVRSAADDSLLASVTGAGANATLRMLFLDLKAFAGQTVYVDVVDAFQGGWGWISVDEIRITPFETDFNPKNFTFEAENFNFEGGKFFDNIVLCNTIGGGPNCYFDRVGTQGIDKNELDMNLTTGPANAYRFGPTVDVRGEFMDTRPTADLLARQQYETAGIRDYELRLGVTNSVGEWVNYTRTFPAGTNLLYARVPSGVPSGASTLARVDMVQGATGTSQTLITLGWFLSSDGAAGLYERIPLTDLSGTSAVLTFDGTPKTLRVTALANGYVANFYQLDPSTNRPSSIPQVTITSPTGGAILNRGSNVTIVATAAVIGSDTITDVEFFAGDNSIGMDNAAPYSIAWTALGANLITLRAVATTASGVKGEGQISVELTGEDPNAPKPSKGAIVWNFEGGNNHGFNLRSLVPTIPTADDPAKAGDEALTGGLPGAGVAWTIGKPNQFDGQLPVVAEGCHDDTPGGTLLYTTCNNPFGVTGDPPYSFINGRGQTNYLNTYALNQWGDNLHSATNDQIATSRPVLLREGAKLTTWAIGNTASGRVAPALDPVPEQGYVTGSGGIAVRSAADGTVLTNLLVAAQGINAGKMPDEFNLDLSAFAGQTVIIEVVDAFAGGWGFLCVDEIRISNALLAATPAGPVISVSKNVNGEIVLTFEGKLFEAQNVGGPYTEVVGATSPRMLVPNQTQRFYRSQSSQ